MKRLLTIAALCSAMVLAPAMTRAENRNGTDDTQLTAGESGTQRSEWLPEFTGVYVSAAVEIIFIHVSDSEAPRIVYDTKGASDTKFKAFVDKKGVLNITEKIMRDTRSNTSVEVYYHSLESLEVTDAYVSFSGPVQQKMMKIDISGGGKISADVDITDLEVVLSGKATRAKFTGTVRYLEISASSGLLDAGALEAMSADVTATYGAGVAVRVTERLKASASTSATVSYRGTPAIIKGRSAVLGGSVKDVNDDAE